MFLPANGTCNYTLPQSVLTSKQPEFQHPALEHELSIASTIRPSAHLQHPSAHPPIPTKCPNSPSIGAKHLLQVPSRHLSIQSGEHTSKGHDVLAACQNHTSTSEAVRLWAIGHVNPYGFNANMPWTRTPQIYQQQFPSGKGLRSTSYLYTESTSVH